jgi:hypothetical protein
MYLVLKVAAVRSLSPRSTIQAGGGSFIPFCPLYARYLNVSYHKVQKMLLDKNIFDKIS